MGACVQKQSNGDDVSKDVSAKKNKDRGCKTKAVDELNKKTAKFYINGDGKEELSAKLRHRESHNVIIGTLNMKTNQFDSYDGEDDEMAAIYKHHGCKTDELGEINTKTNDNQKGETNLKTIDSVGDGQGDEKDETFMTTKQIRTTDDTTGETSVIKKHRNRLEKMGDCLGWQIDDSTDESDEETTVETKWFLDDGTVESAKETKQIAGIKNTKYVFENSCMSLVGPLNMMDFKMTVTKVRTTNSAVRVFGTLKPVNFEGSYVMTAPNKTLMTGLLSVELLSLEFTIDFIEKFNCDETWAVSIRHWRLDNSKFKFHGVSDKINRSLNRDYEDLWPKVRNDIKIAVVKKLFKQSRLNSRL